MASYWWVVVCAHSPKDLTRLNHGSSDRLAIPTLLVQKSSFASERRRKRKVTNPTRSKMTIQETPSRPQMAKKY